MNHVFVTGRLTTDVELRYAPVSGSAMASGTIAVEKQLSSEKRMELKAAGKPSADFIRFIAFGKTAEILAQRTRKGLKVLMEGSIQTGSFKDKNTGQLRYTTDVLVSRIEMIERMAEKPPAFENAREAKELFDEEEDPDIPF